MTTVWIIAGLLALILGAKLRVRGGSRPAARLGVPPIDQLKQLVH